MRINYFLLIFLFISCTGSEPYLMQQKNEVWSVIEVDGEFKKDKITLLETYEYDEDGFEIGHLIYDIEGNLVGKELAVFDEKYDQPVGSRYYTPEDSLLSYYSIKYDKNNNKLSKWGFDGSTEELLRMESFSYDNKGNMITKEIRDAASQLQRTYQFKYDAFGNETMLTVLDSEGNELLSESYKISKFTDDKKWLENWAWRNDKPVVYRKRSFEYSE